MRPGETTTRLRSATAPYLPLALKQASDTATPQGPHPTSPRRGRHVTEGRTLFQRDRRATSRSCGADISLPVRKAHPAEFARPCGYVSTAFLAACANASLVGILSGARLSFAANRPLAGSPNAGAWSPAHMILVLQSWPLRQAHARAPPVPAAILS